MITDLTIAKALRKSVLLKWTAPSDCTLNDRYDIRYSTEAITEANFDLCPMADVTVIPRAPGAIQSMYINELETGVKYYFAMKIITAGNEISGLSNVANAIPDQTGTPEEVTIDSLDALLAEIDSAGPNGKIITIAPGNYHQERTIVITGKDYLTLQGATDDWDDTVFWGQGQYGELGRNVDINISLHNCQYFTVRNLTIRESYYHAIQVNEGSNYFVSDKVKTLDSGESGYKTTGRDQAKFDLIYCDHGIIENGYIGNLKTASGVNGVTEGIDGIASKGWIVRNNVFENIINPGSGGIGYAVFFKANSMDSIYENNLFINCDVALSFGGGGSGPRQIFRYGDPTYEHRGGIIRNNIVKSSSRYEADIFLNASTGYEIYNNTLCGGASWGSVNFRTAQREYPERSYNQTGKIYNNILLYGIEEEHPNAILNITAENNITLQKPDLSAGYNIVNRYGTNCRVPAKLITLTDPHSLFEDYDNGDFRLKADNGIGAKQ